MKKSIIAIGDIHGLSLWKSIVNDNRDCRIVFLGDYLDPYEDILAKNYSFLLANLKEIIALKRARPDDVTLLLGNHDLHYFTDDIPPSSRFDFGLAEEASHLFADNLDAFQYAFQEETCIFTHAGIAHRWFTDDFRGDHTRNIAEQLNNPMPEQIAALCRIGWYRGGEINDLGGIFWADIHELVEPLQGFSQVVGHNRVDDVTDYSRNGGRIIFCDCLWNGHWLKI